MKTLFTVPRAWGAAVLAGLFGLAMLGSASAAPDDDPGDPPDRVARLSYLGGEVSFQPAGGNEWVQASLNRPLVTGDSLHTDRNSRTELQMGGAVIRIDDRTSINVLNLDDSIAQFELSDGVLALSVRSLGRDQSYEVDTPTLAFVTTMPGEYRIDVAPDGRSTMVTVFEGNADVYGQDNASYSVRAGNSYRFNDSALRDYEVLDLPRADEFDNWVASRQRQYSNSISSRYVSDEMIGYTDLDEYGSWSTVAEYGSVWYPTSVAVGWAPYRYGHWSWVGAWGWTWVDTSPWGFAPFHYGRWIYAGNRWGWCPGPRHMRPMYAPAMVAFVGGSGWGASISLHGGGPVGWFPLGPRDVYVPWYHSSHRYFTNINVHNTTIINNVHITNVYNDYSRGRPVPGNYMWRNNAAALTAVSRDTFVGSRAVNAGRIQINAAQWNKAPVAGRLGIAPTQASFVAADARRASAVPQAAVLERRVIARTAPAPSVAPIAQRIQAIERNNGQPLARPLPAAAATRETAATQRGVASRIQVVDTAQARPQVLSRGSAPAVAERRPGLPADDARAAQRGNVAPEAPRGTSRQLENSRALPSSRFAPQRGGSAGEVQTRNNAGQLERAPQRTDRSADVQEPASLRGRGNAPIQSTRESTPMQRSRSSEPAEAPRSTLRSRSDEPGEAPRSSTYRPRSGEAVSAPASSYQSRSSAPVQERAEEQPVYRSRSNSAPSSAREYSQPEVRSRSYESVQPQRESAPQPSYRSRSMESAPPQRNYQPAPQQSAPQPSYRSRSMESASPQRTYQPAPQQSAPQRVEVPRETRQAPPARESAPARQTKSEDSGDAPRGRVDRR